MSEAEACAQRPALIEKTAMTVEIVKPGPLSLIQDGGRVGSQHLGIAVGGVADRHAAGWANRLLGNTADSALVEICLGGLALRFLADTWFALTGADMQWTLDGRPLANWQSHRVQAGALLRAGMATQGLRAYLALHGGISLPAVCGSRATTVAEGLGGIAGQGLRSGDRIPCFLSDSGPLLRRQVPVPFCRHYSGEITLRVVPSNQFAEFSRAQTAQFFANKYRVSAASDRMGVRLEGEPLPSPPGKLVSEPVCTGAIQVPANGLPIVLMQDCQTIGGYPKLGHVYRADLDHLAQARPGAAVTFAPGNLEEAQAALLQHKVFFTTGGRVGNG